MMVRARRESTSQDLGKRAAFLAILIAGSAGRAFAGDGDAEFFEKKVRPVLVARCQKCHESSGKRSGGLALDSKAGWEAGGDSGPVVKVGDPDGSPLIGAIRWSDEDLRMPPEEAGGRLTPDQVADLETWVRRGAFDPRIGAGSPAGRPSWDEAFKARRNWWSLRPVARPTAPEVARADWSGSGIDRFLARKMEAAGVAPSPEAEPRTLIRRASLVLTGLPPSIEESDAFEAASREGPARAYRALVDRLLASPRFGERFARHWLDVVRFSETHGNEWNYDVPHAWRYRDYVIRAFNDDLPYDRFVREHIAGDLLPDPRWNAEGHFNESAIGTAFYRFGEVNHDSCVGFGVIGYDIVDNQLDTLTKAFQATTVACARCHDHKADAVSSRDYHALLAVLRSSRSVMHTLDAPGVNRGPIAELKRIKGEIRPTLAGFWRVEAASIDAGKLGARLGAPGKDLPAVDSPARAWLAVSGAKGQGGDLAKVWERLASEQVAEQAARKEFNRAKFRILADFRGRLEPGWTSTGMGLRDGPGLPGDLVVADRGEAVLKGVLPAGLYTFGVSSRLNGALRSPTLDHRGKVSFEVLGGGHSLSRIVFNNCQLNYTQQQSIHHDDWTWLTITIPDKPEGLHPYAELLTFWDSPKFPDPLGTLGKDVDNQRGPFEAHAKDPRTWWGLRRVVAHDGPETPKPEIEHLARLFEGGPPSSPDELAARYARVALGAVDAFEGGHATDDDVAWLNWLIRVGLLPTRLDADPGLTALVEEYREVEGRDLSLPRTMPGLVDEGEGFAQPLLVRGDYTRPAEPVPRGFLRALEPDDATSSPPPGSGRALVADRIASADNPLTSRVMANRVWQWMFGRGLARTPDDFGHLGEAPTHPELLDFLAIRFVEEGWSVKRLAREIALTRAFRGSAVPTPEAHDRDPDDVLLSHYPARRAEAEVIRDGLLAASGRLDGTMFGPSVTPYREKEDSEKRLYAGPLDGDGRRSLYIKFQLMEPPRFLEAFNLPGGKVTQGRRDASNVPAQSLALLNDPFVTLMADHWAGRLILDGATGVEARVDRMFRLALGRPASTRELERFAAAVAAFAEARGVAAGDILGNRPVWKDAAHALFNLQEFLYIP